MKLSERIDALAAAVRDKFNNVHPRLVPAGGTAGQVLTKNTATDYDAAWATPSGGGGGSSSPLGESIIVSGSYYTAEGAYYNSSAGTPSVNTLYFLPLLRKLTISEIGCYVNTAAAGDVALLGLYDTDANGYPSSLIAGSTPIDLGSFGAKTYVLPSPVQLTKPAWLAFQSGAAATSMRSSTFGDAGTYLFGSSSTSFLSVYPYLQVSNAYSNGLPATAPANATHGSGASSAPLVFARAA